MKSPLRSLRLNYCTGNGSKMLVNYIERISGQSFDDSLENDVVISLAQVLRLGLPKELLYPAAVSVLRDGGVSFDKLRAMTPSVVSGAISLAYTNMLRLGVLGTVPMLCNFMNDSIFLANVSLAQQLILRNHRGSRVRASDTITLQDDARYYRTAATKWNATDVATIAMFVASLDVAGNTSLSILDVAGRTDIISDALLWTDTSISSHDVMFSNIAYHDHGGVLVAPITRIFANATIHGNLYCNGTTQAPLQLNVDYMRASRSVRASGNCEMNRVSADAVTSRTAHIEDVARVHGTTSANNVTSSSLALTQPGPNTGDRVVFQNVTVASKTVRVSGNAITYSTPLIDTPGSLHVGNVGLAAQTLHMSARATVDANECLAVRGNLEMLVANTAVVANAKSMHMTARYGTVASNARIDDVHISSASSDVLFAHPTCLIQATGTTRIEEMVHDPQQGSQPIEVRDMRPALLDVETDLVVANGTCIVRGDALISGNAIVFRDVSARSNVRCFANLTMMSHARTGRDAVVEDDLYASDVVCGSTTVNGPDAIAANAVFGALNLAAQGSLTNANVGRTLNVLRDVVCVDMIAERANVSKDLYVTRDGEASSVDVASNAVVVSRASIQTMIVDRANAKSASVDSVVVGNVATVPVLECTDVESNTTYSRAMIATSQKSDVVSVTRRAVLENTLQADGDMNLLLAAQAQATIRGSTTVSGPVHLTGKANVSTVVNLTRAGLRVVNAGARLANIAVTGCVQVNSFTTPELQANTLYCGDKIKVTGNLVCMAPGADVTSVVFGADIQSGPLSITGNVVARDLACGTLTANGNVVAASASMGATVCRQLQCDAIQLQSIVTPSTSRATITTEFDARQSDVKFQCNVTVSNTMNVARVENVGSFNINATSSSLVSALRVRSASRSTAPYISSGSDTMRFRSGTGVGGIVDVGTGSGGSHSSVMRVNSSGVTMQSGKDVTTPACLSVRDLVDKYLNGTIVSTSRLDTGLSVFKNAYPLAYYGTFDDIVDAPYIMDLQYIVYLPTLSVGAGGFNLGPIQGDQYTIMEQMQNAFKATHVAIHSKLTSKTSLRRVMTFAYSDVGGAGYTLVLEYPFGAELQTTNVELMFVTLVNKGFFTLQGSVNAGLADISAPFYDFSKVTPVHRVYSFTPTATMPAGGRYFLRIGSQYAPIVVPLNAPTSLAYAIVSVSPTNIPSTVSGKLVRQEAYNPDSANSFDSIWPQNYSDRAILYSYSSWARIVFYYRRVTAFYNRTLNDNFGCQKTYPAYSYIPQSTNIPVFQEGDIRTMTANRLQLIPVDIPIGPAQITASYPVSNRETAKTITAFAGTFSGRNVVDHFTTTFARNIGIDGNTLKPAYPGGFNAGVDPTNKSYAELYSSGEYFIDAAGRVFRSITESAAMIPWHNFTRYELGKYIFSGNPGTSSPFLAMHSGNIAVRKEGSSATFVRCNKYVYHKISVSASSTSFVEVDMKSFLQNPIKLEKFYSFFEYDPAAKLGEVMLQSIGPYIRTAVDGVIVYNSTPVVQDLEGGQDFASFMEGKRVTLNANTGLYAISTIDANAASNTSSTSVSTGVSFTVFGINVLMSTTIQGNASIRSLYGTYVPADFREMLNSPTFQILPRTSGTGAPFSLRVQRASDTVTMIVDDVDGIIAPFSVDLKVVENTIVLYNFFNSLHIYITGFYNANRDDLLFEYILPADQFSYVITNEEQDASKIDVATPSNNPLLHLTSLYITSYQHVPEHFSGEFARPTPCSLTMGTKAGVYARWWDPSQFVNTGDSAQIRKYQYTPLLGGDDTDFNGDGNKGPVYMRLRRLCNNTMLIPDEANRRAFGVLKSISIPAFTRVDITFFAVRGRTTYTVPFINNTPTMRLETLTYKSYPEPTSTGLVAYVPPTTDYAGSITIPLYHGYVPYSIEVTDLL